MPRIKSIFSTQTVSYHCLFSLIPINGWVAKSGPATRKFPHMAGNQADQVMQHIRKRFLGVVNGRKAMHLDGQIAIEQGGAIQALGVHAFFSGL